MEKWLTLRAINVDVNIYIIVTWINMLEEIILIIQPLTVVNVRDHLRDLVIWRNISEPVLVLKNDVLVLLQSLGCERLVNRLEMLQNSSLRI